ncbi:hypothetical protein [Streptomyces sp. NPDC086766]
MTGCFEGVADGDDEGVGEEDVREEDVDVLAEAEDLADALSS